jgi:hypothetical protein
MRSAPLILILMLSLVRGPSAATAILSQAAPPDYGFDPLLLFVALFFGGLLLVLVGVGVIVGLACLTCAAILVALGIISSSALIAMFQRRFSAGLRALHYQLLALFGLPCGIGTLWLGCWLFGIHISHLYMLAIGSAVGIIAGIIIAIILDRFFLFIIRRLRLASASRVST